jgi:hypothetical protein
VGALLDLYCMLARQAAADQSGVEPPHSKINLSAEALPKQIRHLDENSPAISAEARFELA